jgi:flagellar assembly factor FliW
MGKEKGETMKVETRLFGEIDIADEKIIRLEQGIVGFPFLQNFALIYDAEKENKGISWLQSMDEPEFAMPVIDPHIVDAEYNPLFPEELLDSLGDIHKENAILLVTMTVPQDIKKMSINLKAPFVINSETRKAAQIIVEQDFPVKYYIYDQLNKKAGD